MTRDGKERPEVGQGMEQRGPRLTREGKRGLRLAKDDTNRAWIDQGWNREGLD